MILPSILLHCLSFSYTCVKYYFNLPKLGSRIIPKQCIANLLLYILWPYYILSHVHHTEAKYFLLSLWLLDQRFGLHTFLTGSAIFCSFSSSVICHNNITSYKSPASYFRRFIVKFTLKIGTRKLRNLQGGNVSQWWYLHRRMEHRGPSVSQSAFHLTDRRVDKWVLKTPIEPSVALVVKGQCKARSMQRNACLKLPWFWEVHVSSYKCSQKTNLKILSSYTTNIESASVNQDMKENTKNNNIKNLHQNLHQFAGIKWGNAKKKDTEDHYF